MERILNFGFSNTLADCAFFTPLQKTNKLMHSFVVFLSFSLLYTVALLYVILESQWLWHSCSAIGSTTTKTFLFHWRTFSWTKSIKFPFNRIHRCSKQKRIRRKTFSMSHTIGCFVCETVVTEISSCC